MTNNEDAVDAAMWFAERAGHAPTGELSRNILVNTMHMVEIEVTTDPNEDPDRESNGVKLGVPEGR